MSDSTRFPSPFSVTAPAGAENWRGLYNWYHVFDADRQAEDDSRFWFQDALHHPSVLRPYDEIQCECWWQALGAFNTRIFAVPPAFGVDQRILNGYLYVSPVPAPPEQLQERIALFSERAGHYYANWESIYAEWKTKVLGCLERIRALDFRPLPDIEDADIVSQHVGFSSGYRLIRDYDLLVLTMYETYQYHFELLNIGYAAYLTFFDFMRRTFPDIGEQTIAGMVGGLRVELYRPDDELKRLAREALRLALAPTIEQSKDAAELFDVLVMTEAGREWLADWERTSDPWFLINTDPGHPGGYSSNPTWLQAPDIPLAAVRDYLRRLQRGEVLDRPTEELLRRRDETTAGYRELLDDEDVGTFDELVELARNVFTYIEEHVLYIEHWMWATFWAKSRDLSRVLVTMGALEDAEDLFFLRRYEVMETLYDVVAAWSVGAGRPRSADHWREVVAERRRVVAALESCPAPPALGVPPEAVNEPLTRMLWGITTTGIQGWLGERRIEASGELVIRGLAGAPGVAQGRARVVSSVSQLAELEQGEVLVCPATSPAWAPVFSRIVATVSDVGGIMSHTAIVCREYGLPAVVGTGDACRRIRTGQLVRVDGGSGEVTVVG